MKLLIIIFFFYGLSFAQSVWKWQNPYPQGKTLNAIQMFDNNRAVAIGDRGTIIKTVSAGEDWQVYLNSIQNSLLSLSFVSEMEGWVSGENGSIYKTSDGGFSLAEQSSGVTNDLLTISFIDASKGFAAGTNGVLLKTGNGGSTWSLSNSGTTSAISKIQFTSSSIGYMIGEGGLIIKTLDGGDTWNTLNSGTILSLTSAFFLNDNEGWVTGYNGIILHSSDAGNTWTTIQTNSGYFLKSIAMKDNQTGWAVGLDGLIIKTINGVNWLPEPLDSEYSLNSVAISNGRLLITGEDGAIMVSSDGAAWDFKTYGARYNLNSIVMIDYNYGWVVGDHGTIFKTTNGGNNWIQQNSGVTANLNDLCYINKNRACIIGDSSIILQTSNGGNTWSFDSSIYKTHLYYNLNSIIYSENISVVVGDHGLIYISIKDSLKTWKYNSNGNEDFTQVVKHKNNAGEMIGANGQVLWYYQFQPLDGAPKPWIVFENRTSGAGTFILKSISIYKPWVGWIVGEHGIVLKKTDGISYRLLTQLDVSWLNSVHFINITRGFTVGTGGSIFKTVDGGFNWNRLNSGVSTVLNKVLFLDNNIGWVIGENGLILKTETGGDGITDVPSDDRLSYDYELTQNYPNPFNPETNIDYYISKAGNISIKVYDILGKEVKSLVNEYKNVGNYTVTFSSSELPSGIYFYRMQTEGFTQTKKMIILR